MDPWTSNNSANPLFFYVFSQMSTNVPVNCMTVTSMPTATIPSVPIDAPAIPGTKETEQAAIFVSLTNIDIKVTSVCYDTRISHSLSFCIVIWSLQFWKYIFLIWVGPESRPRWNSSKNGLHYDPLLLSISTDILLTVLYTYRVVLPRELVWQSRAL